MAQTPHEPVPGDLQDEERERRLDESLKQTFPASDPLSVTQPVHKPPDEKRD